jgi:hypothetical protein
MGEFDKLEPVGSGRIVGRNFCFRCVVREGTHGNFSKSPGTRLAHQARKVFAF